jgi:uncharacterized protein (UPF0335 family)
MPPKKRGPGWPKKTEEPERKNSVVAADELRQFIEQWESLESDKKAIAEQQKDIMSEAKARGYDTKVMRAVIAERKKDPDAVSEFNAILDLYREVLGMS